MKVADKIALLKSGVKFSELAELEKQELEEMKQELELDNEDSPEKEQTLKDEEEEKAEKLAEESDKEKELLEQISKLQEENKKMKDIIHKENVLTTDVSKGENKAAKLTPEDVMNQLFHPDQENGGK